MLIKENNNINFNARNSQIRFADDNPVMSQIYEDVIAGNEHRLLHRNMEH